MVLSGRLPATPSGARTRVETWRTMFAQTPDQQLFEQATARFLEAHYPVARVRALAESESTFEPAVWQDAARLGWTTLLAGQDASGGSISGNGLADMLIVAF